MSRKARSSVTTIDVARKAGVYYATVSHVLNKDTVRLQTRERVLIAVTRLGYAGDCTLLELPHPPATTSACNDVSAFGVMKTLHKHCPHIPYGWIREGYRAKKGGVIERKNRVLCSFIV
jgi:DNA-binding LacI/PurR family transcriptional regulator